MDAGDNSDEQRALLAAIVDSSDDAIVSKTLGGIVTSWNRAAERIFGYSRDEMIGQSIMLLIPADRPDEEAYIIDRIKRGERVAHYETVRRRKDGRMIDISLTVSPIHGEHGRVIGASKIARDITERKRQDVARRLLAREVNHRSKNLLAVVEAIVRQTARNTPPAEFTRRISQRLRALSANQDLLVEANWIGIELNDLARLQIGQIDPLLLERVAMSGPQILATPAAAQAIGMALNELVINAALHGALSVPSGRVTLNWEQVLAHGVPTLCVSWRESGGPAVERPHRLGFGGTVLERITANALGGDVRLDFPPEGLTWELSAPAKLAVV